MSDTVSPRDPDEILAAWLADGPTALPAATRRAIAAALPATQRPARGPQAFGWRASLPFRIRPMLLIGLIAVAILLSAVFLGGGGTPTISPTPSESPSDDPASGPSNLAAPLGYAGTGTIAYTTHDAAGDDDLWLVDPAGTNARLFVDGGCCGLFSPDGSLLAVGVRGVAPGGLTRDPSLLGIELFDPLRGTPTAVVPTGCGACAIVAFNYEPDAWSPDGRYLALAFWSDDDPSTDGMGIADRDFPPFAWDWPRTATTGNHSDIPIAFSPDSSMLLFLRQEERSGPTSIGSLFLLRVADDTIRQITPSGMSVQTNGVIQGPASWSPDGETIVFAANTGAGTTSIFATGVADDAPVRTVVADATGATSARFAPDGTVIAFDRTARAGGFHDLYRVNPDGSGQVNLTADFAPGVCCGQWSPDGRALLVSATSSDDFRANLFIVAADASGIWQVTTEPGPYTAFVWGAQSR